MKKKKLLPIGIAACIAVGSFSLPSAFSYEYAVASVNDVVGFNDFVFNVIANTYILANSFWIMVIRASYSNRFAYLSWFLYPLVFAYPLSRMNIWEKQERKTAFILLAYTGFTLIMFLLR